MKTLIPAVVLATILSTPALAEKMPIKSNQAECEIKEQKLALQMTVYQIDDTIMMLERLRKDILKKYPKKPVNNYKKQQHLTEEK